MRGEGRATVAWRQLCARSTGHRAAAAAAARLLELLRVLPFPRGDRGLGELLELAHLGLMQPFVRLACLGMLTHDGRQPLVEQRP